MYLALLVSWQSISLAFLVVLLLVALEQALYVYRKGNITGSAYTLPLIGKLWASFFPTFEGYIAQWNQGSISCSSVLHKFIVFATSNENTRKVFNSPDEFSPTGVASMRTILCEDNWVFLSHTPHLNYRKSLTPLFSRSALASYIPLLERAYKEYIAQWLKEGENGAIPLKMQFRVRDLNMGTALAAFCGKRYLPVGADLEMSEAFKTLTFAMQLVNIPFALPGTAVYAAVCARDKILKSLYSCVEQSQARLGEEILLERTGEESPLLDRWIRSLAKEGKCFDKREIALVIFSFIFASQDASTSSLIWAIQVLAEHPEVLKKIREEQSVLRPQREALSYESLEKMVYLRLVVKELLRYRPPVLMMPYEAQKDTSLEGHNIKKGTFVIASTYPSLYDPVAYAQPEKFDPERFSEARGEDKKSPQNYMVWGHGPHMCIGREYAMMHLGAFIAYLSMNCEWNHVPSEKSNRITINATTYPSDGCVIRLRERV